MLSEDRRGCRPKWHLTIVRGRHAGHHGAIVIRLVSRVRIRPLEDLVARVHVLASAFAVAGFLACAPAVQAGFVSEWNAGSGLRPDQISPPWTLTDTATPEDPVLSAGVLTLSA